ncbi:MarR family winged helix-turn-helix transcriptional regulator [Amycolatopsis speibonae]|uniref:MarR family winged helix-turn-helix transcriptional regulator n=1 Tax=Amycolatopsis speibonae TaxID=1450224 RepID=A0ABV7PE11_9PSEU
MHSNDTIAPQEARFLREPGRLTRALIRLMEHDINRAAGLAMTNFAVLLRLNEAPEQQLRMAELAAVMGLTPSRITRVVDQLLSLVLVTKNRDPDNFRGVIATVTGAGLAAMNEAPPHRRASARRRVLDHVPVDGLPVL